jgi:hypothetical protein
MNGDHLEELIALQVGLRLAAGQPTPQLRAARRMSCAREPVERAYPGAVRRGRLGLEAPAADDGYLAPLNSRHVLFHESRLPDAGFARDHDEPAAAGGSFIERSLQGCELWLAAHEEPTGGGDLRVHRMAHLQFASAGHRPVDADHR